MSNKQLVCSALPWRGRGCGRCSPRAA